MASPLQNGLGVGKTSIVEGLAERIASGNVPAKMAILSRPNHPEGLFAAFVKAALQNHEDKEN